MLWGSPSCSSAQGEVLQLHWGAVRGVRVYLHLSLQIVCFSGQFLSHRSSKGRRGTLLHGQQGQEPVTTLWLHQRPWCGQRIRSHFPKPNCIKETHSISFHKIFPITKIPGLPFGKLIQLGDQLGSSIYWEPALCPPSLAWLLVFCVWMQAGCDWCS